jgi:hypothetical protein
MVKLWDVASRKERISLLQKNDVIVAVAFSPDGKTLASGGSYRGICLWETATGMRRARLVGHAPRITSLAFTADGKMLAAGGWNDGRPAMVELWNLATSQKWAMPEGVADSISSVAFTPDGRTLASAVGPDTTIRLWDVSGLAEGAPVQPAALSQKKLEELWTDLASADAAQAFQAIWALTAAAPQAVPWLKDRVRPVVRAEPHWVARLIADLDRDRFAARTAASRELEKLGESVGPALYKVLTNRPSPETRQRVEHLLEKLEQPAKSPERLRVLHAIEVLEHIATPAARQVLEPLAAGMPEARVTQEAQQALGRLAKRIPADHSRSGEKLPAAPLQPRYKVGDSLQLFVHEHHVTGPNPGIGCYLVCTYSTRPVVMVYTRDINDAVIRLIKKLDTATRNHQQERLGSYVVLFCHSYDRAAELKALAEKEKIQHTLLAMVVFNESRFMEDVDRPRQEQFEARFGAEAETTVILATSKRVVKACSAYRKGELTDQGIDRILAELPKILPAKK